MRAIWIVVVGLIAIAFSGGPNTRAQIKQPKPPDVYDVQIRYRIQADRNERVLQFDAMSKYFGSLGFKETETDESDLAPFDPNAELMSGTIPSKTARDLLADRRVQTILLAPSGYKPPEKPDELVRVRIELSLSREQLALYNQVNIALKKLGYVRDVGFDTRRFTVTRGAMPAGNVAKLIRDLRHQPSGWLLTETPPELYVKLPDGSPTPELVKPFGEQVPVRVVEILGPVEAPPSIVALPPIPADAPHLAKWTADLRRKLAEEGAVEKPLRLEVVLAVTPADLDLEWRRPFAKAGAVIEGRVGNVVTVIVPQGARASNVAALPEVTSVRLPRTSSSPSAAEPKKEEPKEEKKENLVIFAQAKGETKGIDPLKSTRLDQLHAANIVGKGIRVVIIDTDFAGWEKHLAARGEAGGPPGRVSLVDLTADRNRDVKPEPMPGEFGHGTRAALAVRLAAPAADLVLVRIPPDAPYHVINTARYVRGDEFRTEGLVSRRLEMDADIEQLQQRQRDAIAEYRRAFEDFSDDDAARKRRIAAQDTLKKLAQEELQILARLERIEALEKALAGLKGAQVVVSQLYWNTGFALDAASTISRFLDDWLARPKGVPVTRQLTKPKPAGPPLWFQPAGDTRGQSWTGLFHDFDRNGAMEFASPDVDLKPGRWSRELNFLASRTDGKESLDLTQGAKVRISVQWREPHDPSLSEEDFRVAVAPLKLQLVKQRDPSGEKYGSDEIDMIAESEGLPSRLHIESNFAVYEHSLELTIPADGRYAIRIEGSVPPMLRPSTVPTLPDQEIRWELRPRLFVESADGQGKFVLADYASSEGGVAVPGDARSVFAVGAIVGDGKISPETSAGAGPGSPLKTKPDLFAPTDAGGRSDMAAAFAAGFAATMLSGGLPAASFPHRLKIGPGSAIHVPDEWLRR